MKISTIIQMLESGKHSNPRIVDFLIDQHPAEKKATRNAYQSRLDAIKKKLAYFSRLKKVAEKEAYGNTDFVFPTPKQTPPPPPPPTKPTDGTQTTISLTASTSRSTFVKHLENQISILENKVQQQKAELKRRASKIDYLQSKEEKKTKKMKLKLQSTSETVEKVEEERSQLQDRLDEKKTTIKEMQAENEWLQEMVSNEVVTQDDAGHFTTDTQECVCDLLSHNVSQGQVSPVMQAVLKLAGKTATKLPSKSTVNEWNVMRRTLAQQQLAEELPKASHVGLLSDETSKYGKKIEGFHVADENGKVYVLGLRRIASKAGHDVLSTFNEILSDIDDYSMESQSDVGKTILLKIMSTMSDRAATQLKFNELLEEYRKEVLPDIVDNYDQLTEDERKSLGKLSNFFCGLHSLVHLAEAASSSLTETDKKMFNTDPPIMDRSFMCKGEAGATRLVRTACKALAEGGDQKSGCHGLFLEYVRPAIEEDGFRRLPLTPFRGNRFNILFENAASVFYLSDHIRKYLEAGSDNKLLKAVFFDVSVPEYVAGCKALGLVSFLVTQPMWATIEDTSIHLLDIGRHYQEIIDFLEKASNSTEEFIRGKMTLSFSASTFESSVVFKHLVKQWEHDDIVLVILQVMLPTLARLLQRIFADHLEGGRWDSSHITGDLREKLLGLPKHNKFSESVFGHLDNIMKQKPNISAIASEACIMFTHNDTGAWIAAKSPAEKEKLFRNARRSVKDVKAAFQQRQKMIREAQRTKVMEKLAHQEQLDRKRVKDKEQKTLDILYWGLWQSTSEVDNYMATLNTKGEKVKALKAQLNFRQKVLLQKPMNKDDKLFAFSKEKRDLTPEQLGENLKLLIQESFQVQGKASASAATNDQLLVGKRIQHLCTTDDENEAKWWTGKVISQVPGFSQWFNIKYDEDPAIYTYQLMEDYEKGDLKILI